MHPSGRGTASPRGESVLVPWIPPTFSGLGHSRMTNTYEPYLFTDTWAYRERAWPTMKVSQALLRSVALRGVG